MAGGRNTPEESDDASLIGDLRGVWPLFSLLFSLFLPVSRVQTPLKPALTRLKPGGEALGVLFLLFLVIPGYSRSCPTSLPVPGLIGELLGVLVRNNRE